MRVTPGLCARRGSWVATRTARPSAASAASSSAIEVARASSRCAVGSSRTRSGGSLIRARARARRAAAHRPRGSSRRRRPRAVRPKRSRSSVARVSSSRAHAVGDARQEDVLARREAVDELEILEHEADLAAPHLGAVRLAEARRRLAVEVHLAARRREHRADDREQRRLAAAARTAHDDELAAREVEARRRRGRCGARAPSQIRFTTLRTLAAGTLGVAALAVSWASGIAAAIVRANAACAKLGQPTPKFGALVVGSRCRPLAKSLGFPCWHQRCFHRFVSHGPFRKLLLVGVGVLALHGLQACASETELNPQPLPPQRRR